MDAISSPSDIMSALLPTLKPALMSPKIAFLQREAEKTKTPSPVARCCWSSSKGEKAHAGKEAKVLKADR